MPAQQATSDVPGAAADPTPPWRRLVDGGRPAGGAHVSRRQPSVRRVVGRFLAANLVIVAVLVAGSMWASRTAARSESLADACVSTRLLASMVFEPNLTDPVLAGDPQALAELDDLVAGPLQDAEVARIKIWDDDLRIV